MPEPQSVSLAQLAPFAANPGVVEQLAVSEAHIVEQRPGEDAVQAPTLVLLLIGASPWGPKVISIPLDPAVAEQLFESGLESARDLQQPPKPQIDVVTSMAAAEQAAQAAAATERMRG